MKKKLPKSKKEYLNEVFFHSLPICEKLENTMNNDKINRKSYQQEIY